MKTQNPTFATLLKDFEYRYDLRSVFDDFLTLTICSFSYNPKEGKSPDEDLYLSTIEKYKSDKLRHHFPKLLGSLVLEMDERVDSDIGNDVLGEYFEFNLSRGQKGQYFTPWPICRFMAQVASVNANVDSYAHPLHILDPACGSGRMSLASAKENGQNHSYYGIDIDHTCVKMAVINFFLNGLFHAEVMWADALHPDDFRMSYRTSFLPFGVFRIEKKEHSPLWNMHQESFGKKLPDFENAPELRSNLIGKIHGEQGGSQLVLL